MPRSVSDAHVGESVLLRLVVGDLDPAEREGAERHLWTCSSCREAFRATERLDAALRVAGPALSDGGDDATKLSATDPFARRPEARLLSPAAGAGAGLLAEATARAVPEARELATRLNAAFEDDGAGDALLATLDLNAIRDRLALAYSLDGAFGSVEQNATRLGRLAAAALERISREEPTSTAGVAERAVPLADLTGRALLLSGAASLFGGDFSGAETRLRDAWRAFGEGRGSEPLLARTEVLEALRRVVERRWDEAESLATRAGETFALTGAGADAARAILASGLAAWGNGRIRAAQTLLRKSALGFKRAEAWGGFSMAACGVALCRVADGQVEESRRIFRDLRRRKARRAPLAERMFIRETERVALLLVREPGKKKGATFRFSAGDIPLLWAGSALGDGIVSEARGSNEELAETFGALYDNPASAFALLYACQKGSALVTQDPLRALLLSHRVYSEARLVGDAKLATLLATPALREIIHAEAKLLEAYAKNMLGRSLEARVAAAEAREQLRAAGDSGYGLALTDFHEGSAASFAKDYVAGERLLGKALKIFAEFGQDGLIGRAETALGTLFVQRGDQARALPCLNHAIEVLDHVEEMRLLTMALNSRGVVLSRSGRFNEAKSSFAKALRLARRLESAAHLLTIRSGLAEVDLLRGQYERALKSYRELAADGRAAGWPVHVFFSDLYTAECLGRLGREEEMAEAVLSLRAGRKAHPFAASPALDELFACLDQGAIDADLVAHVRSYLEDEANGIHRRYKRLKLVG